MSRRDTFTPTEASRDVQQHLLELVRTGGMGPGKVLPSEAELVEKYNTDIGTLRAALHNLERMGILDLAGSGPPIVAQPSAEVLMEQLGTSMLEMLQRSRCSVSHLREARVVIEVQMARAAAAQRSSSDITELRGLIESQWAVREDRGRFLDFDCAFHKKIASISGNPIFEMVSEAIFTWMRVFHVDQVRKLGLESLTIDEHKAILKGIVLRDEAAAAEAMRAHICRSNELYHLDGLSG